MRLLSSIVLSLLCVFPAVAQEPGARAELVVVRATGAVSAAPEIASIRVQIASEAPTTAEATAKNQPAIDRLKGLAGNYGVAPEDVEPVHFSLVPNRESAAVLSSPFAERTPRKVTGYDARLVLRIRIRDASKAGAVLEALLAAGLGEVSGVEFGLADPDKARDEARRKAVAESRRLATLYAQAAGVELGALVSLTEESRPAANPPGADTFMTYEDAYKTYDKARRPPLLARPNAITTRVEILTTWSVKRP